MTLPQLLSDSNEFYLTKDEEILIKKWSRLTKEQKKIFFELFDNI